MLLKKYIIIYKNNRKTLTLNLPLYFPSIMYLNEIKPASSYLRGGSPLKILRKKISIYELEVMTRTCTNIFGEVFGPYAYCCPCEALEQKYPENTNLNERRYSLVIYTIRFVSIRRSFLCVRTSKSDEKSPSLKKWRPGPFWANNW